MSAVPPSPDPRRWLVCVCDELLAPHEARLTVDRALAAATAYQPSGVMDGPHREHDATYRRSTVCYHEPSSMALLETRLMACADAICERLHIRPVAVTQLEMQLVCTGHGGYYRPHRDDGNQQLQSRRVTCVYYLHREPRAFEGGDLRIHIPSTGPGERSPYVDVEPRQNRLVAFPSSLVHEVRPVTLPTNRFEDRRFALSAWLHP